MAETALQSSGFTVTVSGNNFRVDVKSEYGTITRSNNTITMNNVRAAFRYVRTSGTFTTLQTSGTKGARSEAPSGTLRNADTVINSNALFNVGQDYWGNYSTPVFTVGATDTTTTVRQAYIHAGNNYFGGNQVIPIPPLGTPSLSSQTVTNITPTTATVTATATAGTNSTGVSSIQIQYGTTTSYGTNITDSASPFTWNLTGLIPGTVYFYRFVITNAGGRTTTTSGFSFTTLPAPNTNSALLGIIGVM